MRDGADEGGTTMADVERRLDRRRFLRLIGMTTTTVAAGGLLQACGGQPAASPAAKTEAPKADAPKAEAPKTGAAEGKDGIPTQNLTLNFWNGLTGPDGRIMEELTVQFMGQYSNIKIEQQQIQWNELYTKMLTAIPAGEGPEMALMHTYEIPRFADGNNISELTNDELQAQELNPSDFYELAWKGGSYKDKRYAMPLDVPSMGLYLNNELFKKANLWEGDKPKAPTNMDEFLSTAKAMTRGDEYGLAWGQQLAARWQWQMLVWQNGGDLFDDKENPTLDSPAAIEVTKFFYEVPNVHQVSPTGITSTIEAFRTGKFGMTIQGGWNVPALQAANMDFTVAPIPQLFKQKVVWASSHQFVLPTQKNADENERRAALGFYNWLTKNSVAWAKAGHVVARKSVVQSPDFQALKHQVVLAGQEPYWRFQPATHKIIELETRLPATLDSVILGNAQPEAALKQLNDEIRRVRV
jgi:multiple sugar transport system substrate-binding protein